MYDISCVQQPSSVCNACCAMLRTNSSDDAADQRGKNFISEARSRINANAVYGRGARLPPCQAVPIRTCRICERKEAALPAAVKRKKRRRPVRASGDSDDEQPFQKQRGRPSELRSSRFPVGRPTDAAPELQQSPSVSNRPRFTAHQFLAIGSAISEVISNRAMRRLSSQLQRDSPVRAPTYISKLLTTRNNFFNKDFVAVPVTTDALPLCRLRSSDCSSGWQDAKTPPPCASCRWPLITTLDVVSTCMRYISGRGDDPSEVAVCRFGIDGGGLSIKFMFQFLLRSDPLLRTDLATTLLDGAANVSLMKNSGASRAFIVAALPNYKENSEDIQVLSLSLSL